MTKNELYDLSYDSKRALESNRPPRISPPLSMPPHPTLPDMEISEQDDLEVSTTKYEIKLQELDRIRDLYRNEMVTAMADFEKFSNAVEAIKVRWAELKKTAK